MLSAFAAVTILALGLLVFTRPGTVSAAALDRQGGPGGRGGNGQGTGATAPRTGISLTPLSDTENNALNQAIVEILRFSSFPFIQ